MRKTAIFKNDLFLMHDPGLNHPERIDRLRVIYSYIETPEVEKKFVFPGFEPAELKHIERNHDKQLVDRVAATAGKSYDFLDQDTATSAQSYDAARYAAGSVMKGVDLLVEGEIDNGFALVRPPGHHAERDRSMGFCLFNNVAVAACHAKQEHNLDRVMLTGIFTMETEPSLLSTIHQKPFIFLPINILIILVPVHWRRLALVMEKGIPSTFPYREGWGTMIMQRYSMISWFPLVKRTILSLF